MSSLSWRSRWRGSGREGKDKEGKEERRREERCNEKEIKEAKCKKVKRISDYFLKCKILFSFDF